MNLSSPRLLTFIISLALAALAIVSFRMHIPVVGQFVAGHRFETMVAAYVVLALGVVVRGL